VTLINKRTKFAFYDIVLVLLSDCGERQNFPVLTTVKNMANQVILMQPLHHNDDDAIFLAVEATRQSVVVPVVNRCPACLRERILRLEWVINDQTSPPRPVRTPPTEVAMRNPCAVVMKSSTDLLDGDNRACGKTRR